MIWQIENDGTNASDHIEMSGFYASSIISYGNDSSGRLHLMRHLVIPTLRVQPNVTQSSFSHNFNNSDFTITVNNKKAVEYPKEISIKGNLKITSFSDFDTEITREFLPAVNQPALIEIIHICNNSDRVQKYKVTAKKYSKTTNAFWCVGEKITAESSVVLIHNSEHRQTAVADIPYSQRKTAVFIVFIMLIRTKFLIFQ